MSRFLRPGQRWPLVAVLVVAFVSLPLGVIASHQFGDVPDSNTYHDDIDAIADTGVTTGCGGGNYCPAAFVTREQMAAFMNRLGALGAGKTPVVNAATAVSADNSGTLDGLDSSQFVRSDVQVERHYSCTGPMFSPFESTTTWSKAGSSIYATAGGQALFGCGIHLPDGSIISAVHFHVTDNSTTEQVSNCGLRAGLLSSGVQLFPVLDATGDSDTLGTIERSQTGLSILIDNTDRAYYGVCLIEGNGTDVRIVSLLVDYLALEGS